MKKLPGINLEKAKKLLEVPTVNQTGVINPIYGYSNSQDMLNIHRVIFGLCDSVNELHKTINELEDEIISLKQKKKRKNSKV